jgi:hypothetical protein
MIRFSHVLPLKYSLQRHCYANDKALLNIMHQWMQRSESNLQICVVQRWKKMLGNCGDCVEK